MKIGLVGYQGSGKSSLFQWLTGIAPDPALSHVTQSAMAAVPDPRIAQLCEVYQPKKVTVASLELVDTPGLDPGHEGNAARLGLIREAGCLVHVVGAFGGADPLARLASFDEDLLLADLEIVTRRVEKLRDSVLKPRPNRDQEQAELAALEPLLAILESGTALSQTKFTEEQEKATRSFRLLTEKPRLVVINTSDDDTDAERYAKAAPPGTKLAVVPVRLALELSQMEEAERVEFQREFGIEAIDRDGLIRLLLEVSGQRLFFTAGEKEVRTWMLQQGGTAVDAAAGIHTDLARGFVRAEVMTCSDLVRLGSEREVKAANLLRREPKDYVVKDDDILHILSNA
ncbi:MAG: DUF933 domain-containing protein [Planctomycetia bacterium]|nr:DUF933 domain-containing protein [Planctomycetia bacterium]